MHSDGIFRFKHPHSTPAKRERTRHGEPDHPSSDHYCVHTFHVREN